MAQGSKVNQIVLKVVMLVIVLAFVFTGVQSFTNSGNQVASVDGTPVKPDEYNNALNRTLSYWTQINQGKSLSQKEIRERGIREQVLEQLISSKLMLNFASSLGFDAGKQAVKYTLMSQYKEFQTAGKFDITKYKQILKLNRIPFKSFEESVIDQFKVNRLNDLFSTQKYSKNYAQDVLKFKNQIAKVKSVQFSKEQMTKYISIPKNEVEVFLDSEKSQNILKSLYSTYKARDPKKNTKTLKQMKKELATSHLQRTKRNELTAFNEKLIEDLKNIFEKNDWKKLAKISKKYGLDLNEKNEINLFNPTLPGIEIDKDKMRSLFKQKDTSEVITGDTPLQFSIAKPFKYETAQMKDEEVKNFLTMTQNSVARSLNYKILELKRKSAEITRSRNILQ